MTPIEPVNPDKHTGLTGAIKNFWTEHVNAERIYGNQVTKHKRGTDSYFVDIENQRYRSHRHLLPWIHTMQPGKSVLEIGSGIGIDTYTMTEHGLNVTAIDLTHIAVHTANTRFMRSGKIGSFAVADACTLPFPDNSYDYVYSFGVLHHASDTAKTINEVYRVLKPGGEARIMLYNRRSLNEIVHRITGIPFEDKDALCPVVRRFTRTEVQKLFSAFNNVEQKLDYVFGEGYGLLFRLMPRWLYNMLSRYLGWHIMILATK